MMNLVKRILLAGFLAMNGLAVAQVQISEFVAINRSTIVDEDGDASDWIELFNGGADSVDLNGWYLTDEPDLLTQWSFPSEELAPGEFLVVFASGKDRRITGQSLHTNFSLSSSGEYLALVGPDGVTIAHEFAPAFPEQFRDISYGMGQTLGEGQYFSPATPGRLNTGGFLDFVGDTKFSHDRGFYSEPFDLEIVTATTGAEIRYSTDGTPPTAETGNVYVAPVRISRTTVLRAAAFKDGFEPSNVDTQTYLFLEDVIRQSRETALAEGWPRSWGSNTVDYGMDPDIVDHRNYRDTIIDDLKSLPSFSIVMSLDDLLGRTRGIYANPSGDGRDWERPASVEYIDPSGGREFQINGGIRIRGGFSRSTSNPKHAFRLFFREEYGASKLRFPLFGDSGADTFDGIDLRTFQNYSWSFQGDNRGIFVRDMYNRDLQLAMGHPGERGDFYHLYINGQYWGIYNTAERPEASYGETYFGGDKDDYDVVKVDPGRSYTIYATDGNLDAWRELWTLARRGLGSDAAYQRVLGNNPDGSPNLDFPVLVDPANLIDYMLIILFGGNLDAPISNFLGNSSPNNFFALRNRNGREGFRSFVHDAEHTLLNVNQNRTGPYSAGNQFNKSNPQYIWQQLQANNEFKMLIADHIHRHFFNNGILTTEGARALFDSRTQQIERAVVAESARWGDAKRGTPLTRDGDWRREVSNVRNSYLRRRPDIVLGQLRQDGLYPSVVAPEFSQHGGIVEPGYLLSMTIPAGEIYYTRDGSDPRLPGGAVSPRAIRYSGAVVLEENGSLRSRTRVGEQWSALNEASFTLRQDFTELVVSEFMYHPIGTADVDGDEFEFIELKNVASTELDLSDVHFVNGIQFRFPVGTRLGPGRIVVLVRNRAAFSERYPGVIVEGEYMGALNNGGEEVTLVHATGEEILSFAYDDEIPWPIAADSQGFSVVNKDPNALLDSSLPSSWRASPSVGGSPGADDRPADIPAVHVSEILTNSDAPLLDSIELYNPSHEGADIGYWYLSDNLREPKKYQIPAGTMIPANGYLVFNEEQFNAQPEMEGNFTLSSAGEEVYLFSADVTGELTGYSDGFQFGAADEGVTLGIHFNSTGEAQVVAQGESSLGRANSGPLIGSVVISEIYYAPSPGAVEFVEIKNITEETVFLFDEERPEDTWRLRGVGFEFEMGLELVPLGLALVVAGDPDLFRIRNNVPEDVGVYGPYDGTLQNNGERLSLQRPGVPSTDPDSGEVTVPYLTVDSVRYDNRVPWPIDANSEGASLERIRVSDFGDEPTNWRASHGPPSPGTDNDGNRLPIVAAGSDIDVVAAEFPVEVRLLGTATDDGLPTFPGELSLTWIQVDGPGQVEFFSDGLGIARALLPGLGRYVFELVADDGELQAGDRLTVTTQRPSIETTIVPANAVWRYLDDGSDQGRIWRASSFDDSAWDSGAAQLGYGDGDEETRVSFGPNAGNKFPTTYFRHAFEVSNPSDVTSLKAELIRDDGAVVYLNGREVFRSNMPDGAVDFQTFAASTVGNAEESAFFDEEIDPTMLVAGRNVLAVEIHQTNRSSSDLSFVLKLTGLVFPMNRTPQVTVASPIDVLSGDKTSLRASFVDDGLPVVPGIVSFEWEKVSGPGDVRFSSRSERLTDVVFMLPGTYLLRVVASDGELSSVAEVEVIASANDGSNEFERWIAEFFSDPDLRRGDLDPDGDGHSNAEEFAAGTLPNDATSVLWIIAMEPVGDSDWEITFQSEPGLEYVVEARSQLRVGAWRPIASFQAEESISKARFEGPGDPSQFYRIRLGSSAE